MINNDKTINILIMTIGVYVFHTLMLLILIKQTK